MGRRSGVIDDEGEILKLTLPEIDAEIARCEMRRGIARSAYLKKSFAKRIHWIGRIRQRHPEMLSD